MMLQIVLLILKIIGWIILAILGTMVLFICVTVFTPLRYEVFGKGDGDLSSLNLKVKFSYFLHLISGTVQYADEKLIWKMRIAWKKLGSEAEVPEAAKAVSETSEEIAEETVKKAAGKLSEEIKEKPEEEKVTEGKPEEKKVTEEKPAEEKPAEEEATDPVPEEHPAKDNPIPEQKRKGENGKTAAGSVDGFFDKIAYKFELLCGKMKELVRKKETIMEFLTDEIHKAALIKGISELKRLVRGLKPGKLNGNIEFGAGDPALTGKVLAGVSILYPYFAEDIQFSPNFEEKTLKGDCYIKGRASAGLFVSMGLRLLLDKNIRITIRHAKKFKLD